MPNERVLKRQLAYYIQGFRRGVSSRTLQIVEIAHKQVSTDCMKDRVAFGDSVPIGERKRKRTSPKKSIHCATANPFLLIHEMA